MRAAAHDQHQQGEYMHLKILVVEENTDSSNDLAQILNESGHQVVGFAPYGSNALKQCEKFEPDVVLIDLDGSGIEGLETARRIQQSKRLPMVIATQEPNQELAAQAVEADIYAYLVKPLDAAMVAPALELAYLTFQKETTLERQLHDLKKELADRKNISRVVGYFMDHRGLTEKEAMAMLESQAQLSCTTPALLAAKILEKQIINPD